jgi:type VI secretion system protein ImpC
MPSRSPVEVNIDVEPGSQRAPAKPEPETPFRIAVLGDFSGRANRLRQDPAAALPDPRPIFIDRDNFDGVMTRLEAKLSLPSEGGGTITLGFRELEDFHPDRIFEQVGLFGKLRALRRRFADPKTFAEASAELGLAPRAGTQPRREPPARESAPQPPPPSAMMDLLSGAVEATERRADPGARKTTDVLQAYIEKIVAPHTVSRADPRQEDVVARCDSVITETMRAVLHHPHVHALEEAWRSLFFLVDRLPTNPQLKVFLIDLSREEMEAGLMAAKDLRATQLHRLLVEQTVGTTGGEPWAVVVGNYTFEPLTRDAELIGRIAMLAALSGAPFLAAASPGFVNCKSFGEQPDPDDWDQPVDAEARQLWDAVRQFPEASYVGLALPRFLLRLPYGRSTTPLESFAFEEMPSPSNHETYVWGNAAFMCAYLLGQAFDEDGWKLRPGQVNRVDGLPLHVYKEAGDAVAKPCAEALLTDRAAERILDRSLMALLSIRERDAAQLVRFQSLADPPASLSGPWSL